jgi:hypothetical protein
MAPTEFTIARPRGDEGVRIFKVNGVEVGRADYDSHGWQGMDDQTDMFKRIARELRARVQHTSFGEDQ